MIQSMDQSPSLHLPSLLMYEFNTMATLTCDPGFFVNGSDISFCESSGNFEVPLGNCAG